MVRVAKNLMLKISMMGMMMLHRGQVEMNHQRNEGDCEGNNLSKEKISMMGMLNRGQVEMNPH